jgi:disulfide bond formation protein DsbB
MNIIKKILLLPPLVNFFLGAGLIVGAYIFEVVGYYDPCPLCILQRWSFALIALCGLLMLIPNLHIILTKGLLFLGSLFSLSGGIIAGRQIYLQNLPNDQIPACAPPMDFLMDTLPFFEVIQTILVGDGNCAEYEWRFIFNFAEWALIFFIFLFFYNLLFLLKGKTKA